MINEKGKISKCDHCLILTQCVGEICIRKLEEKLEKLKSPTLNEEKLREVLENVFPEVSPSFYHRLHWLDKIFKALKTREKDIIE